VAESEQSTNESRLFVQVSAETLEQIGFLAERDGVSVEEMAARLLAVEAEADAGLTRGPLLRKYMYR
jgi:hypothetical protein